MSFGQRQTAGFQNFTPLGGPITLPNLDGTHVYEIPPISYELGVELRLWQERINEVNQVIQENLRAAQSARKAKKKAPEPKPVPDYEFPDDAGPTPENILGPVLDEMKANNEPAEMIKAASQTVWLDFLYDRETAEQFWNSGGDPKAIAARLFGSGMDHGLDQDQATPTSTSTSTGAANTTKKPASTSGTKSRKTSNKTSTATTKTTKTTSKKSPSPTKK